MNKQKERAEWRKVIKPYENASMRASVWQIVNTLIPFFALWYGSYAFLSVSYLISIAMSVVAGGFLVRTFIIFHDCCHKSFFKSKLANDIWGNITGVLTMFPYQKWANEHAIHHATSSNLDKRGVGDLWTMTTEEYMEATRFRRLFYRLYRNPILMFGGGPIAVFLLQNRFNRKSAKRKERWNTYQTNILLAVFVTIMCLLVGWKAFLLVHVPIFVISGAAGIWLFFIQHTFEDTYFEREGEWSYVQAAMQGSSFYQLPPLLMWLTGNIGYHHIHHLSARIPNYQLEKAHKDNPDFQQADTITLRKSLESVGMSLWDEGEKRFISFREMSKRLKSVAAI